MPVEVSTVGLFEEQNFKKMREKKVALHAHFCKHSVSAPRTHPRMTTPIFVSGSNNKLVNIIFIYLFFSVRV